jgi:hypothetical protein
MHTISFWGADYNIRTLPQLTSAFYVGTGGDATQVSISHHTMRQGSPYAASLPTYTSLSAGEQYAVRISASNDAGFGPWSFISSASTATTAVLPSAPQGVTFNYPRGVNWLEVSYKRPFYDGGALINKYHVEWGSSLSFDGLSQGSGYQIVEYRYEIQQVTTSYRR